MGTISVSKTIRSPWNTSGYDTIVRGVLGSRFSVSIVLVGDTRSLALNKKYRGKEYPANVLTFPLNDTHGEVFINIPKIKREAKRNGFSSNDYAKYMLIHGCLHLKGYSHGSTMDTAENKFLQKYTNR